MEAHVLTAVAVDRDKNSQYAVKWASDHLLVGVHTLILLHIKNKSNNGFAITEFNGSTPESYAEHIFLPYRTFCARKGIQTKEVLLEEVDVAKAISDYIASTNIHNMVVGSSTRNLITRKFKAPDVASILMRIAPEFCALYVIAKGKATNVRSAKGPAPTTGLPPHAPPSHGLLPSSHHLPDHDADESKKQIKRGGGRGPPAPSVPERRSIDKMPGIKTPPDVTHRPSNRLESFPDDSNLTGGGQSTDRSDPSDLPSFSEESLNMPSFSGLSQRDLEAEMKRLRLELKQTMDMYSTACKEAITAKQKRMEEARKFEEARQSEEAALAMAEMEKAKCVAAMEAAQAAQRLAELEAKRRQDAELAAKKEAEEKRKALDALAHNDVRYRKYSIEEIEVATGFFAEAQMIGEGGYGPVYRASLNHTPVAIKVLRPDAQQGRKQFHQEVEVLSCIRHPNMVLLLGACPEYGCLVYEYMDNGSLEDRLFRRGNTAPLPWPVRFRISAEIATALLFLHQTKPEPLVHRDLKPANILIDRNYVSKISDVGLARLVPPSVADSVTQYRMTSTAGTFCYIDPEYQQTGMLGIKSDIYSLGVMLLQIVTAKPPMGLTHIVEKALNKGTFVEMLDPTVPDWPMEEVEGYARLALKCSELRKKDRPDLATVILPELNRLRNLGHAYEEACRAGDAAAAGSLVLHKATSMAQKQQQQQQQQPQQQLGCEPTLEASEPTQ